MIASRDESAVNTAERTIAYVAAGILAFRARFRVCQLGGTISGILLKQARETILDTQYLA